MSHLNQSYVQSKQFAGELPAAPKAFREAFPALAEALEGIPTQDGLTGVPPCTVMVFLESPRLKFCLSPQSGDRVAFGVLDEPERGLASLNNAIAEGRFEWKRRGKGK